MERSVLCCGRLMLMLKPDDTNLKDVEDKIHKLTGVHSTQYYLIQNGKKLPNGEITTGNIHCVFRTLGGKGGFGSMLRAIGAQIEKTTNREACRDLSGRRLRDINEEKRLKAWLDKQKDRETEAEEKRRKKLEKLVAVPKHDFKDAEYESARSELTEKISEAVEEGFKKASLKPIGPAALKRKATGNGSSNAKRAALWIADEFSSSSDDASESDSDMEGITSSSKTSENKIKINEEKSNSASASPDTTMNSNAKDADTKNDSPTKSGSTSNSTLKCNDANSESEDLKMDHVADEPTTHKSDTSSKF